MTSPDGITWTDRNVTSAKLWTDVTYGNGIFVAVNQSGSATGAVMTSGKTEFNQISTNNIYQGGLIANNFLTVGSTTGANPFSVFSTSGAQLFTVLSNGRVGIGTSTPAQALQVIGDIRVGASSTFGCIENFSGTALAGICSSDERLKENIQVIPSVLGKFMGLRPVTYTWNTLAQGLYSKSTDVINRGLIAQEVEAQFPELVITNPDGYKQVDFTALSIYTMKAVIEIANLADSFTDKLSAWLGSDTNKIQKIRSKVFEGESVQANQLCLKNSDGATVCIDKESLQRILQETNISNQPVYVPPVVLPEAGEVNPSEVPESVGQISNGIAPAPSEEIGAPATASEGVGSGGAEDTAPLSPSTEGGESPVTPQ